MLEVSTTFKGDRRVRCLHSALLHLPRYIGVCETRDLLEQPPEITPPHRRPVDLHPFVVKKFVDHGNIDAVQNLVLVGPPVVQEMIDDFCAEFKGGVMERRRDVLDHVAVGESDRTDTRECRC